MEKEIEVEGKKYTIKEITYLDTLEIAEIRETKGLKEAVRKQLIASGIPEESIDGLSIKEGTEIQKIINELNNSEDFQNPTEEKAN